MPLPGFARALPDLHSPRSPDFPHSRPPPPRPACPRCVRRHRGGSITIYLTEHQHRLRPPPHLARLTRTGRRPPSTPKCAHRHHCASRYSQCATSTSHRLLRNHGSAAVTQALRTAVDVRDHAHHHGILTSHERNWLTTIRPAADHISSQDPLAHAICYPAIVTIASVLASPTWQAAASHRSTAQDAFDEIGRRIRRTVGADYEWQPWKRHPLTHWAENQQHQRRHAENKTCDASGSTRARSIEPGLGRSTQSNWRTAGQ